MDHVTIQVPPLSISRIIYSGAGTERSRPWNLFPAIVLLSGLLLFQSELILAKYILPWFGGTPAVWNTCMMFYQSVLLVGYAYSHWLCTRFDGRKQTRIHMGTIAVALVALAIAIVLWGSPLTPGAHWKYVLAGNPVLHIVALLTVATGIPFFLLSTTGPLVQHWFGQLYPGHSPYRLYAISNLGSLVGLLGYPFLLEWLLPIRKQAHAWTVLFFIFLILCAVQVRILGHRSLLSKSMAESGNGGRIGLLRFGIWIGLATCGSVMLLATTNLVCQNIASNPFLWVIPLCIYLISFCICFEQRRWYRRPFFFLLFFVAACLTARLIAAGPSNLDPVSQLSAYFLLLFTVCMVCNGELERSKPSAEQVTPFYLSIAFGGALGGGFVVLTAPHLFHTFYEFQLALLATGLTVLTISVKGFFFALKNGTGSSKWRGTIAQLVSAVATISVLAVLVWAFRTQARREAGNIVQLRNFFGVKTVYDKDGIRYLSNGGIIHGGQYLDERWHKEPLTYYMRHSGLGLLLKDYRGLTGQKDSAPLRLGAIGMGAGTVATYAQPGDTIRFYEIDPQIVGLSQGPGPLFTYMLDSRGNIETVLGDARLSLEAEASRHEFQRFDVLVLDAFSGDAIPVHLLTSEAMQVYLQHLRGPNSVIAVHISNVALDLTPVLRALSTRYQFTFSHMGGLGGPDWFLLCRNPKILEDPVLYRPFPWSDSPVLWTDDYSNLLTVLRKGNWNLRP
jgi:hypothetical protein